MASNNDYEDCDNLSDCKQSKRKRKGNKLFNKIIAERHNKVTYYRGIRKSRKSTTRHKKIYAIDREKERHLKPILISSDEDIDCVVDSNAPVTDMYVSSAPDNLILEQDIGRQDSGKGVVTDDPDQDGRLMYIKLLSKLIDLNMPSKIESNRSTEAYTKRLFFLEKRRHDSDKGNCCNQLFCHESFWLELQHRFKNRTNDRIQNIRQQAISNVTKFVNFQVKDVEIELGDIRREKLYSISRSYLSKIKLAHHQVSSSLASYHHLLSFWSTTSGMKKYMTDHRTNWTSEEKIVTENIESMQAWQTCCEWLNWKTRQVCQMVGIIGHCLDNYVIDGCQDYENDYQSDQCNDTGVNYLPDLTVDESRSLANRSLPRSQSLITPSNNIMNLGDDVTNSGQVNEYSPANCNCEATFEAYADLSRRRYGFSKVCSMTIKTVSPMLEKFQNLLSITKDENRLPLMFSYADALKKDGNKSRSSTPNPLGNLIFSENLSDASLSSYKTAALDSQEYPVIPPPVSSKLAENRSTISFVCSPPMSSNPSQQCFNNDCPSDTCADCGDTAADISQSVISDQEIFNSPSSNQIVDVKGLLGLRNNVAARLTLPPLLPHYLFLARFPVKIMHCCVRKMLHTTDLQKMGELNVITIKQKIIEFKEALQMTMEARDFLRNITYGINFQVYKFHSSNTMEFAPKQDIDHSDFIRASLKEIDVDLSILLRHYIDHLKELLKKWSQPSSFCKFGQCEPRRLLEEEWKFVKTYCHSIKQEEEIVASSFCNLAEYLFDLLKTNIETHHKLNFDYDDSPTEHCVQLIPDDDSLIMSGINNRLMSKSCQAYKTKCKIIESKLKQATDFAKRLRADLEISVQLELNTNYSMNDLLLYLSRTRHKMVDLCTPDEVPLIGDIQSDLTLIIPEESGRHLKELLHPLVTGFSLPPNDQCVVTPLPVNSTNCPPLSREYILIINKKSKMNWPGDKILFFYPLDMGNLRQRIESSNIVFIARRPDQLSLQLTRLFQYKIPTESQSKSMLTFKDILQSCSDEQAETCHYNSKRTLNALKSKSIEIGNTLQNFFISNEKEMFEDIDNNISLNYLQEETLKQSIKNSYSITFEFYRDIMKICTGDAFKSTLKNSILSLLDKWFKFSSLFEPSDKGTVPRWANDGLNFLLQLCQSRIVINMTTNEWQDFKRNIDNFVEFIVGQGNKSGSDSNSRSTASARLVTSRSWLTRPRPDIIRGCDNKENKRNKVGDWHIDREKGYSLRSAFSDPNRTFKESKGVYKRSITSPVQSEQSGFTTRKSSAADKVELCNSKETLKESIKNLEDRLNEKQRLNNLAGFVRDFNGDMSCSPYIKRAPFQWIKKEQIGQGHSGTVYRVCNLDTMEIMAMKEIVINEPFSHDRIESELLCKLTSPCLLKYYGVDISLSHVRIFTEYCDSGSLLQVSVLDIPEIILRQWTKQVLDAIVYLHDHKIVHRDVKPDNIFLINSEDDNTCYAKLGDFGAAKYLNNHDEGFKDVQGTMMYMAPEVVVVDSVENVLNIGYNHKVDIWSLGCVVLYMVTGKSPWPDMELMSIYYNLGLKKQPHVPDEAVNHRMTKEARDFINSCIIINPSERPEAIELKNYNFVKLSDQ